MKQGEIWYANLNPTKGSEQNGFRPVLIISGNVLNSYTKIVITCPLTTKIKNYKGNIILQPTKTNGLIETSEVLTFHIRSLSKERLVKKIGTISKIDIDKIKTGLDDILRY
ncbi:MAG: type II toxin-antitoxin system PemK/MazF family toxin [Flavobacteriaceae bacterium]|nr:type II toxin-antitoxin system PemK/MazF family toxin [Flavobacteriaceae bacterium]